MFQGWTLECAGGIVSVRVIAGDVRTRLGERHSACRGQGAHPRLQRSHLTPVAIAIQQVSCSLSPAHPTRYFVSHHDLRQELVQIRGNPSRLTCLLGFHIRHLSFVQTTTQCEFELEELSALHSLRRISITPSALKQRLEITHLFDTLLHHISNHRHLSRLAEPRHVTDGLVLDRRVPLRFEDVDAARHIQVVEPE